MSKVLPIAFLAPSQSASVSVESFGADPLGKGDSTIAIQQAIETLRRTGQRQLVFPHGTYKLTSVQRIAMDLNRLSGLVIEGNGSSIIMGHDARCVSITNVSSCTIRNLKIDWEPLPFTQGIVVATSESSFRLRVDHGFPAPDGAEILAVGRYSRSLKNLTYPAVEMYGNAFPVTALGADTLEVQLKRHLSIAVGDVLVIRFKQGHEAISVADSDAVRFENVDVYSSYSIGFSITRCKDLAFRGVTVGLFPGSERLLSTNADGLHITNCRGSLKIDGCRFQGTGDDAININAQMWILHPGVDGTRYTLASRSGVSARSADIGSNKQVEILESKTLQHLGATNPAPIQGDHVSVTVDGMPGPTKGDDLLAVDPEAVPTTEITTCEFLGNRARAIVAHRNLQVRHCNFSNTTLAAILIAPDSVWLEGPLTENVTIDQNTFEGCHYLSPDPEGSITVDIEHTYSRRQSVPFGEAKNVTITDNIFTSSGTAAIACRSVDDLLVEGNKIGKTWTIPAATQPMPAMIFSRLRYSKILNNVSTTKNSLRESDSQATAMSGNVGFTTP